MQSRVPITLRSLTPHAPAVPTVNGFDLFCVLEQRDPHLSDPGPNEYHLPLAAAHRLATGYAHADARTLRAYLAAAAHRWETTREV